GSGGIPGGGTAPAGKLPTITVDHAIPTALQRNPALLNAEQEIKRTKGVIIQVRAQALPHITASRNYEWIDPHLQGARIFGTTSTGTSTTPGPTTGAGASLIESPASQVSDIQTPLADPSPTPITNLQA